MYNMKQSARQGILSFCKRILALGTGLVFFFLTLWPVAAADFTLPRLEMASRGSMDNGEFVLSSFLSADFALTGGFKYSFILGFSLDAPDIAKAFAYRNFKAEPVLPGANTTGEDYNALAARMNNQAVLSFRIAKATVRETFGLPLELSYFLGSGDDFCTGDEFSSRFGLPQIGTEFRGYFYFPEGIGFNPTRQYNGIHGVRGTGLSLTLTKWEKIIPMLYLYQDFMTPGRALAGNNHYSGDLRLLLHHNWLRVETFGGASLNADMNASIRAGLMLHLDAGHGAEFFAQGGIPGWIQGEKLSIDNMFFLIEPRLRFGLLGIFVTFFYHPMEYLHIITPEEKGKADFNIKFQLGKRDSGFAGGIETGGELKTDGFEDFILRVSPFVSFITGGLRWDAKIRIAPLEYDVPERIFEIIFGVRTAF